MDQNHQPSTVDEPTNTKHMEEQLKDSLERLRYVSLYSSDIISIHDKDGRILFISSACRRILGYNESELIGKDAYEFVHADDHEITKLIHTSLQTLDNSVSTYRIRKADSSYIWFESSLGTIRDEEGTIKEIVVVSRDITKRKLSEQKLQETNEKLLKISTLDGLTGVANRRHFDSILETEWKRAIRYAQPISLILFDIDSYKAYNDTYGHPQGDDCLQQVASAIKRILQRPGDFLARYGGEEFAIILPNTDSVGAAHVAETVRHTVESLQLPHSGSEISSVVTVSAGVATIMPEATMLSKQLVSASDQALYLAKKNGRNQIQVYKYR